MDSANNSDSSHLELASELKVLRDALAAANILRTNNWSDCNLSESTQIYDGRIKSGAELDICSEFTRLVHLYQNDEEGMHRILQLVYQVVKSYSEESCSRVLSTILTNEFAELLVDLIFSSAWNKILISDALICLKLYCLGDSKIVYRLWHAFLCNNGKNENQSVASMHVLIQFFDEFKTAVQYFNDNRDVEQFIFKLLRCEEREKRKAALYLMKKKYIHADAKLYTFWISYITLLESLEENQSHLILPSLNSYKQNEVKNDINLHMWIDTLYIKILAHQNILVIRWAIENILESYTCAQISTDVLLQFIMASNNTQLYNYEGYFIPTENIQTFLEDGILCFMECMTAVNFKCVPLHFWLTQIHLCQGISCSYKYELILKIAAIVRPLQNPRIRLKTIEIFENIFYESISNMRLSEYVVLIETMYNVTDPFNKFETFKTKLLKSLNAGEETPITSRFYEIATNNLDGALTYIHPHLRCVHITEFKESPSNITGINSLNEIAYNLINNSITLNENTIWVVLMIVFESGSTEVVRKICQSFWDFNLDDFEGKSFDALSNDIISKLTYGSNTTTTMFVRNKFTDFFVKEYLTTYTDLFKYKIKAEDILSMGSHKTLIKLSLLLANYEEKVATRIIHTFLKELKRYSRMSTFCYIVTNNLLDYLKKVCSSCELVTYAEQILCLDLENVGICTAVLRSGAVLDQETYIKGILYGEARCGDARTEELYLLKIDKKQGSHLYHIRSLYIHSVPLVIIEEIIDNLINKENDLSVKKPRYFEHSMEHRLKLRISRALFFKLPRALQFYEEDLLDSLLDYNNQLNVNYMLEFLVAKCLPRIGPFVKKLDEIAKYTPSQQVSLISIVHCHCILNITGISMELRKVIINKLLPLTMGAHFQTRLYAQLAIYKIVDEFESTNKSEYINLQKAIALAVGPQLKELLNDARLLMPHIYLNERDEFYDYVMFITSAPSEEYLSNLEYTEYDLSKRLFSKKKSLLSKETPLPDKIDSSSANWNNLQRKMNPESDLLTLSGLVRSNISTDSEMFVVASLVDKIPNLGGIARTCEVLGIRNLILSSRKLVEKEEFKSVSMTAEKNLNVDEVRPTDLQKFFKEKQADGFKIIGAEQTVDSVNIVGFEFPRKCVLVLGHEKEGIPSNILGFLDNTIEIPQFGLLRSLNVHVTGAMFMWEYCKQHIVKNAPATTLLNP